MPLQEFWSSVRTGARFLTPRVTVDSPRLSEPVIERSLRNVVNWLHPKSVAGFNAEDFSFLPDDERRELAENVARFREISRQVPPTAQATDQQINQALPYFLAIVKKLEFDRFGDADAFRIGKQVERTIETYRPKEVVELRFDTGLDHTGDPALWIWVILCEDAADEAHFAEIAPAVRTLLESAARNVDPERWPYVRFRTTVEQAELAEAVAP